MGLEFKMKNLNLLDDIEAELSKKLNLKISFDNEKDSDDEVSKNEDVEKDD